MFQWFPFEFCAAILDQVVAVRVVLFLFPMFCEPLSLDIILYAFFVRVTFVVLTTISEKYCYTQQDAFSKECRGENASPYECCTWCPVHRPMRCARLTFHTEDIQFVAERRDEKVHCSARLSQTSYALKCSLVSFT